MFVQANGTMKDSSAETWQNDASTDRVSITLHSRDLFSSFGLAELGRLGLPSCSTN